MSAPSFDPNTWYSLQNLGTRSYLGCNSISICGADTNDLTNFELFQIDGIGDGESYFIRPKSREYDENGAPFCINIVGGQPFLSLCNQDSGTWGAGYWNGNDAQDGVYLFDRSKGDADRLFVSDEGTWSFPDFHSVADNDLVQMKWSTSSRAAINDQSYSTTPGVIPISLVPASQTVTGSVSIFGVPDTSSALSVSSQTSTESMASLTSSSGVPASTDAASTSATDAASSSVTVAPSTTGTAGSTRSTSETSTGSMPAATQLNGARRLNSNTRTAGALVMMFVAPQLISCLL